MKYSSKERRKFLLINSFLIIQKYDYDKEKEKERTTGTQFTQQQVNDKRQNAKAMTENVSTLLATYGCRYTAATIDGNPFIGRPLLMVHAYTD